MLNVELTLRFLSLIVYELFLAYETESPMSIGLI